MIFDDRIGESRETLAPVLMIFDNRIQQCTLLRPVGTRGGCGDGWGPCACPRWGATILPHGTPTNRTPTRTGTRPPHPPNPAHCPYRTEHTNYPIRSPSSLSLILQHDPLPQLNHAVKTNHQHRETGQRDMHVTPHTNNQPRPLLALQRPPQP